MPATQIINVTEATELARTDIYHAPSANVSLYAKDGVVHVFAQDQSTDADMDEVRPVIAALMDGKSYTTSEGSEEDVLHFTLTPA
jgi:hypothetical protein